MNKLKDICETSESLVCGLRNNALRHRQYKLYTSMDRAVTLLYTGQMFLADGSLWNDCSDRGRMTEGQYFGQCFSYSTVENIAMWMLYGGDFGKNGAMFSFPQGVIKHLLSLSKTDVGCFDENGRFRVLHELESGRDFVLTMIDVVYAQKCSGGTRVMLTCADDHYTADAKLTEAAGLFVKDIAWSYERESRMVLTLTDEAKHKMSETKSGTKFARLRIPKTDLKKLNDSLYRSPVYSGRLDVGKDSVLFGGVEWSL